MFITVFNKLCLIFHATAASIYIRRFPHSFDLKGTSGIPERRTCHYSVYRVTRSALHMRRVVKTVLSMQSLLLLYEYSCVSL